MKEHDDSWGCAAMILATGIALALIIFAMNFHL